jgi:hypothetical protein
MAQYSYQIGTTSGGTTNVESLSPALPAPRSTFEPWSVPIKLGDGTVRGGGYPTATWNFGVLSRAQRDKLRTYCTGKSASVYIRTKTTDNTDSYKYFSAVMIWPDEEERVATRRLDFVIEFRMLVEYTP